MLALDTNILARYYVEEDNPFPRDARAARGRAPCDRK